MKQKLTLFCALMALSVIAQGQQFPDTDSLRNFNNKYIQNNAAAAFTNLRLHNLLDGLIDFIDTALAGGGGGVIGIDTIYAANDSTIRYRKNGVFRQFTIKGVADYRRKMDTLFKLNDTTLAYKINGVQRTLVYYTPLVVSQINDTSFRINNDTIYITGRTYTPGSVIVAGADGKPGQDNSRLFWDRLNGRLGIGLNSPQYELNVLGQLAATGGYGGFVLHDRTTNAAMYQFYSPFANALRIYHQPSGLNQYYFDNGGLGIGLTPLAKLHVLGEQRIEDGQIRFVNNGSDFTGTDAKIGSLSNKLTFKGALSGFAFNNNANSATLIGVANSGRVTLNAYPGLTKSNDTTAVKPIGVNSSGDIYQMDGWAASGGGAVYYTNTIFVDSAHGNNSTGLLDREDKPFATIDAALDAGASVPSLHIKIGFGSYARPTPAKMRAKLWLEGSGKPGHNGVASMSAFASFVGSTNPTRLVGGTIILGKVQNIDKSFLKITHLGIDQGPDFVTGGGTEDDCIGVGSVTATYPFVLMQGMYFEDLILLCKDPLSAKHCIVTENVINVRINNVETIYGQHGVAVKGIGGLITNVQCHSHGADHIIIKGNDYANSWKVGLYNFECDNIFGGGGGGVWIQFQNGTMGSIFVANGVIQGTYNGLKIDGTVNNTNVNNVYVIGTDNNGIESNSDGIVIFRGCGVYGTGAVGWYLHNTSGQTYVYNSYSHANTSHAADATSSAGGFTLFNGFDASSNGGYGVNAGSGVQVGEYHFTSNTAGDFNGTINPTKASQLARANIFSATNSFPRIKITTPDAFSGTPTNMLTLDAGDNLVKTVAPFDLSIATGSRTWTGDYTQNVNHKNLLFDSVKNFRLFSQETDAFIGRKVRTRIEAIPQMLLGDGFKMVTSIRNVLNNGDSIAATYQVNVGGLFLSHTSPASTAVINLQGDGTPSAQLSVLNGSHGSSFSATAGNALIGANDSISIDGARLAISADSFYVPKTGYPSTSGSTWVNQLQKASFISMVARSKILTITSNTTLAANVDADLILIDATAGNVTVTLPAASAVFTGTYGRRLMFARLDNAVNSATLAAAGGDTISGMASGPLTAQYQPITLVAVTSALYIAF